MSKVNVLRSAVAAGVVGLIPCSAMAGFGGQAILGPITLNSIVSGDLTGKSDDNDGWFSGDHIFDLWDGGDDVWQLDWPGGDLMVRMSYDNTACDPDLFLYTPANYDESSYDSYANTGIDSVIVAGAAAGTYYVLVDSSAGAEGAYRLEVIPAPAAAWAALGGVLVIGRRRR
ncbi:MAG: hypothetical protein AMXMBFR58_05340 [Phycisphaerae bacterium]|nr:hypothetical protein [Phycisphaerales bacterium]